MRIRCAALGLASGDRQRGAVLLFALISLVVMMVVGVAWVRSLNSSLLTSGSAGLKRDMRNQSERAVDKVLSDFRTGGSLSSAAARSTDAAANNYSATMLPSDVHGMPSVLALSDSAFAAVGHAVDLESDDKSVKIRYVVDRLCATAGDETTLGTAACVWAQNPAPADAGVSNSQGIVYRVSIKVVGPRRAQSLFQSTFTVVTSAAAPAHAPAASPDATTDTVAARSFEPRRLNWRELPGVD